MNNHDRTGNATFYRLRRQVALTRAGLVAERAVRAFWPLWTIAFAVVAILSLGLAEFIPGPWLALLGAVAALAALVYLGLGLRRFRIPSRDEALARLDATLPGRPLAALRDSVAVGSADPDSSAVWAVHQARMAERASKARAPAPDLRIADRDPYALRYIALTVFAVGLLFGSLARIGTAVPILPGGAQALAAGPVWEGWIRPPAYTGRPAMYLNDIAQAGLEVPQGSRVVLRFYGDGGLSVSESVSAGPLDGTGAPGGEFLVEQNGRIAIEGPGGRSWDVAVIRDLPPTISATDAVSREADGRMKLPFEATDDYGVVAGQARIALNLPAVDRRHGLAAEPEPRDAVLLDLPLPFRGDRTAIAETLLDDLSKHPFANLPVTVHLEAQDAAAQIGLSPSLAIELPGKRFFDPLAAAIAEARRDLLWTAANAPRTAQVLRAVTHRPEGFIRNERAFLRLRVALRRLEAEMTPALSPEVRDELAEVLWEIALMVEQGDLASALERLRRAQDRLDEAMRNGASDSEIAELMQELRDALDNYMRQLAEEAERNPDQQMSDLDGMQMSGNQLQELLDRLQELMEQGRMAEAAELMEMLRQLMENMQVTQGPGGQGQGEGQQAMRDLAETLRDQRGLSDEAFRELQEQFNPGGRDQGRPGQEGRDQGEAQQGEGGGDGRSLADRQRELRDRLGELGRRDLPGQGTERGENARRQLDRAGRAMRDAEEALREEDLPGALDRQAEAMDALREGMRELGEALAEDQRRQDGGAERRDFGQADPRGQRDPLGREQGQTGRIGTDQNMLQGDDVYRRAQDLLEELRRRSGEQERSAQERDYIRRLLDQF
ncbi:MAG: DUF4175 domain-containing protein [Gemmobacter sp.]